MKAYATIGTSNCELSNLQFFLYDINRDKKIDSADASKVLTAPYGSCLVSNILDLEVFICYNSCVLSNYFVAVAARHTNLHDFN